MNIAFIGSCLSAQVAKAMLDAAPDRELVGSLTHMRLDRLHQLWVGGRNDVPSKADLKQVLERLDAVGELRTNEGKLSRQTREALNNFRKKLQHTDCLLVDNNYDLAASMWEVDAGGSTWRVVNAHIKDAPEGFRKLGLADLAQAPRIYEELFAYLHAINPAMRIVFLQYPVEGFLRANDHERVKRTRSVADALLQVKGAVHMPLVQVRTSDLSDAGAYYFQPHVYATYARCVERLLAGASADWLSNGTEVGRLEAWVQGAGTEGAAPKPAGPLNPYQGLPERQFWKPAVSDRFPLSIDGLYRPRFRIDVKDRVSTFGSCFAQHIGHRLKARGFNYLDVEPAPKELPSAQHAQHGYGIYSGRYGNVYTTLQMWQLFQEAFGEFTCDEVWEHEGRFHDPLRPNIFPNGFDSAEQVLAERAKHLAAVRTLFESSDVLVFTMGLTECWTNRETGLAYPTVPGATVGRFDAGAHVFRNLDFDENRRCMQQLLGGLRAVNPRARVLLTVSPVPLTATYEDRHVLVSTVHSKSLLRVLAGELQASEENVDYFPSYEIVTGAPFRSMFFRSNLRNVADEGVDYVMSHFFKAHGAGTSPQPGAPEEAGGEFCDEIFLELARRVPGASADASI
jgi:hypothetical protein